MKRILLVLTAFVVFASVGNAKDIKASKATLPNLRELAKTTFIAPFEKTGNNQLLDVSAATKLPKLVFTPIDTVRSIYDMVMRDQSIKPLCFDPISNAYTYVLQTPIDANGNTALNLRTSTDFINWGPKILAWDTAFTGGIDILMPSVKTLKHNDSVYAFTAGKYPYSKDNVGGYAFLMHSIVNLTNPAGIIPSASSNFDDTETGSQYYWYGAPTFLNVAEDTEGNACFLKTTSGVVEPVAAGGLSGVYFDGMITADFETGTMPKGASMPSSLFLTGDEATPVMYSTLLGTAQAGNRIYNVVAGNFVTNPDYFVPGFVYSEDFGATWSEPTIMPIDLLRTFAKKIGITKQDSFSLVTASDVPEKNMVAYEDGSISIFTQMVQIKPLNSYYNLKRSLIEIKYSNGNWAINEIKRNLLPFAVVSNFDVDGAYKAEFDPCFGEVQAANTADGKYTIVKWLEGSVADAKTTDNADVYKSLTTMYVAAKYYTSSTWKIYQLTDNSTFDAHYFMPNTVPNDLVNVPMLCIKPFYTGMEATAGDSAISETKLYSVYTNDQGATLRDDVKGLVATTKFTVPISELGVEDQNIATLNQNIEINNIAPNPSLGDNANVTLTLAQAAFVKVEIFDIMGRLVATPFSRLLNEGCQAIPMNNLNLNSGNYSLVVTSNDFKVSKLMTIVR